MLTTSRRSRIRTRLAGVSSVFFAATALALLSDLWVARAAASAPPVGKLANEAVTTVSTTKDALVALALPHAPDGRVWRLAHDVDPKVLQQISEGRVGNQTVIVFAATGAGTVRVVFAQTHGETATVSRAVTHVVTVR